MEASRRRSGLWLFFRALAPSGIGLLEYVLIGLSITGLHDLSISLSGQAYPASFNDTLLQGYANWVIRPLAVLSNSSLWRMALTTIGWAALGLVIFEGIAFVVRSATELHDAGQDIATPAEGNVVRHPLERARVVRLVWRLLVGVSIILFTIAILPVVRYCLTNDIRLMAATHATGALQLLLGTALVWAVICHTYVVLLRLYVMRTRLFGELVR